MGACPECGLPVRTTLLAVVDPLAGELQAIAQPRLVAAGLVCWSVGAAVAALCSWAIRAADVAAFFAVPVSRPLWLTMLSLLGAGASWLGAAALIRPHRFIPPTQRLLALLAVVAYPFAIALHYFVQSISYQPDALYLHVGSVDPQRTLGRLALGGALLVIILGLRPNVRMLAARSHLVRSGRVDQQTMRPMAAAVLVAAAGDAFQLLAGTLSAGPADAVWIAGTVLIATGSLLFTVGLFTMVVDSVRLARVVLHPGPALADLLQNGEAPSASDPSAATDQPA